MAENTSTSEIIATVEARDPEGETFTYKLSGLDVAFFNLADDAVGELRVNESFDYETKNSYTVIVTASDNDDLSDNITVTINVTDINEAPEFLSTEYTRSVTENTAAGQNIGAPLKATDPEGDALTYTWGNDAGSFDIVTSTVQLRTKDALDLKRAPTRLRSQSATARMRMAMPMRQLTIRPRLPLSLWRMVRIEDSAHQHTHSK